MRTSYRPDPAELAAWTADNIRARRAYYYQPNSSRAGVNKGVCRGCGKRLPEGRTLCRGCSERRSA